VEDEHDDARRERLGFSTLSTGGRKRRSSAYTVSATAHSTVISPIVSNARKSTSMTLTTLAPPPPGSALLRKNGEMLFGAGRVKRA
jgi:hypothetical protein